MHNNPDQLIVIKRYKKSHKTNHGGAWKIAYADFITSMMALFLLMWLINITTEETRKGISDYFTSSIINMESANVGSGVMTGETASTQNGNNDQEEQKTDENVRYNSYTSNVLLENNQQQHNLDNNTKTESLKELKEENIEKIKKEVEAIKQAQTKIRQNIENSIQNAFNSLQEVEKFKHNLIIELTDEGIRIQIVDSSENEMFKTGSPIPVKFTEKIIKTLGGIIATLPNKVEITGHTDSQPYRQKGYSNWELSADRANAARRILEANGVTNDRFDGVSGRADKDSLNKKDPTAPENRRVSITVLYQDSPPKNSPKNDQKNSNNSMPKITL